MACVFRPVARAVFITVRSVKNVRSAAFHKLVQPAVPLAPPDIQHQKTDHIFVMPAPTDTAKTTAANASLKTLNVVQDSILTKTPVHVKPVRPELRPVTEKYAKNAVKERMRRREPGLALHARRDRPQKLLAPLKKAIAINALPDTLGTQNHQAVLQNAPAVNIGTVRLVLYAQVAHIPPLGLE